MVLCGVVCVVLMMMVIVMVMPCGSVPVLEVTSENDPPKMRSWEL